MADLTREFCEKLFIDAPVKSASAPNIRRSRSKTRASNPLIDVCPSSGESTVTSPPTNRRRSKSQGKGKSRPRSRSCRSAMARRAPKSKTKHPQNDPVALYQYYQNEWAHFREQIPGATQHADARRNIRHKLPK
ncbi:uncharacterized protein Dwil_GK24327 [Drosophila willistoni]|uniref:Uncharacterized protein n=1 Tax=Drosophila willistoni TaxID=7260 RepID=A0A0Q9WR89_DROWI|nr:uncharacterized protein LOC6643811 [Drosophila willistoni]KRF98751.1 uncharacterized protein Dwil_GK24327 [Drosophila willistoni]